MRPVIVAALALFAVLAVEASPSFDTILNSARVTSSNATLVTGRVNDTIALNGWMSLRIDRVSGSPDVDESAYYYAAGFWEGAATASRIYQVYENNVNHQVPNKTAAWMQTHISWMQKQAAAQAPTDPFWRTVSLILVQLAGMTDGYASTNPSPSKALTFFDIFAISFVYEISDINIVTNSKTDFQFPKGGCSSMTKPTGDDIFLTHTTWATYSQMVRTYKDYRFGKVRVAFSSQPGMLASGDDWYQLSSGLIVTETTNLIYKNQIYRFTIPESVSEWIRAMVANQRAVDGQSWVETFCRYNSGTYNNQYMVLDLNLFVPGTPTANMPDNLFWITEQMPGMCPIMDVTWKIREQGYWASYNIPFFKEVYDHAGYNEKFKKYGDYFSYTKYARPMIFARQAPNVTSLDDVKTLIRWNKFQTDPLSRCPNCDPKSNAWLALAARGDLVPSNGTWGNWTAELWGPQAFGAIDAKIGSYKMFHDGFNAAIQCGPTHDNQAPFDWSKVAASISNTPHSGQPNTFDFNWITAKDLFSD